MKKVRRRLFLTGAVASIAGLAGCQGINNLLGRGSEGGGEGAGGTSFVRNSLYTPNLHDEINHYGYLYTAPGIVAEHEDSLSPEFVETFASVEDRFEQLGLDFDDITELVYYNRGQTVVSAAIPVETVRERLDSMGFRRQSSEDNFELFATPGASSLVALSDELLLTSRPVGSTSAREIFETVSSLRNGQTDSYADTDPAFASVLDGLGETTIEVGRGQSPPDASNVTRGQFEGVVARGMGVDLGDSESTVRMAFIFDENTTPNIDGVEQWLDETDNMQEPFSVLDDVETETEGNSVLVSGTVPTTDLRPDLFPSF